MAEGVRRHNKELLIVIPAAILFMAVGMCLIYWGFYLYNNIHSLRNTGVKTEGVILRYERRGPGITTNLKDIITVPIVQFQTKSGQSIIVEGKVDNVSILQNLCESGERVEIIYNPDKPEHAVINAFAELWFAPLLLWAVGTGFIFVPPFTIWRHYKGKSDSRIT